MLNHLSDADFKDFIKNYKKYTDKPNSFLINDTTLPSDNPLSFRKKLLKWICNKIVTIDDQINDEKIKYDINREPAKLSARSPVKIGKYQ